MLTVNEVSKLSGVSIRTLHHYDKIGLLYPTKLTKAGYRLYDDVALERLQQILMFRELEFSLKEIKEILDRKELDREKILDQQIALLTLKKEHLEKLIDFARGIKVIGGGKMDFSVFDKSKMKEYSKKAKEQWGQTEPYKEYEEKSKNRREEDSQMLGVGLMELFVELGKMTNLEPGTQAVQQQVRMIKDYITEHFYTCTDEIFSSLGQMYGCGGEFTENINKAAGEGTAEFAAKAIAIYCDKS